MRKVSNIRLSITILAILFGISFYLVLRVIESTVQREVWVHNPQRKNGVFSLTLAETEKQHISQWRNGTSSISIQEVKLQDFSHMGIQSSNIVEQRQDGLSWERPKPADIVLKKLQEAKLRLRLSKEKVRQKGAVNDTSLEKAYYNLSRTVISPVNCAYLISNNQLCQEKTPYLLIMVPSIPGNGHVRNAIRKTFGSVSHDRTSEVNYEKIVYITRIVFILGRSPNKTVDLTVKQESRENKDIIQIDFVDSYFNLTLKVLHGLKWIEKFCKEVTYILKADEDVFVNIPILFSNLRTHSPVPPNGAVYGFIYSTEATRVVFTEGKWAVSLSEYPLTYYPPYAQGTSYILTGNLVSIILNTSQYLPYLHIEDAFITGIVATKIHGAKLVTLPGNSNGLDGKPDPCVFVKKRRLSQTNFTPELMFETWDALTAYGANCVLKTNKRKVIKE